MDQLERCIGFSPSDRLLASNKLVRMQTAYNLARMMCDLQRRSRYHFYWITIINEDWHSRHDRTEVDLESIRRLVEVVLSPFDLHWFGMIEIDIFNNYPGKGRGLWVMPHVHLLGWSWHAYSEEELQSKALTQFLRASITGRPIVAKHTWTSHSLAHPCFYMTKPNYKCKSMGRLDPVTGYRKIADREHSVRPGLTLRQAETLSYMTIDELMLASGQGRRTKRRLIRSLSNGPAISDRPGHAVGSVETMWREIMPQNRLQRSHVRIIRRYLGLKLN